MQDNDKMMRSSSAIGNHKLANSKSNTTFSQISQHLPTIAEIVLAEGEGERLMSTEQTEKSKTVPTYIYQSPYSKECRPILK